MDTVLSSLRIQRKTELVGSALRLYGIESFDETAMRRWIDHLVDGGDIDPLIAALQGEAAVDPPPGPAVPCAAPSEPAAPSAATAAPAGEYAGSIRLADHVPLLRSGMSASVRVVVGNRGCAEWRPDGDTPVNASYHWRDRDGNVVQFDGVRSKLPAPIGPGSDMPLDVDVVAPTRADAYRLELTLVREGVCWFEQQGFETLTVPVDVQSCLPAGTSRVLRSIEHFKSIRDTVPGEAS